MNVRTTWLLVAAALLSPTASLAQRAGPPLRGAVLLGFEDDVGPAGLQIRFDGEMVQRPLAPSVGFSIVGSIGFTHWSDDGSFRSPWDPHPALEWEDTVNVFKLIPAARFTFGRHPRIRPYADAGIGLYYASWEHTWQEQHDLGGPVYTYGPEDSEVGLMFRFAGGIMFDVSSSFSLGGEIGLNPYIGDMANDTTTSFLFAAGFRL